MSRPLQTCIGSDGLVYEQVVNYVHPTTGEVKTKWRLKRCPVRDIREARERMAGRRLGLVL